MGQRMRFIQNRLFSFCAFFLLNTNTFCAASSVVINEFLAFSEPDPMDGSPRDWVELYNPTGSAIDLEGYSLTDNPGVGSVWVFPSVTIEPHGFLRVWASGKNRQESNGIHTSFALSRGGEFISLSAPGGAVLDQVYFGKQRLGVSYGRQPDGGATWFYFAEPTPAQNNRTQGYVGFADPPLFSRPGGIYQNPVTVEISSRENTAKIAYTLAGSPPSLASAIYSDPLSVTRTLPIRARIFTANWLPSDIITHTYIVGDEAPLPAMSLVTDPKNLWDRRTGIYQNSTQRGWAWERPVSVEYFRVGGSRMFSADAGLRIHGGASRTRLPKRSFRLYFRSVYGPAKLNAPIFPSTSVDSFDKLVLRAGFNDTWTYDRPMQRDTAIFVSDQVVRDLHIDMGFVAAHGTYATLYLNGEYWGLYNICERIDEDFLASHYGFPEWDVIKEEELHDGDLQAWNEFKGLISRSDLSKPADYNTVCSLVDLDQITSYYIINIWVQNYDWPHHNWYAARERQPMGRWKFFLWDVEYSFGSGIEGYRVDQNTFATASDRSKGALGELFSKLLRNSAYRSYFLNELEKYLGTTLSEAHVTQRLDEQLDMARPVIPREAERWAQDKTIDDWEHAAQLARDFILRRTAIVRKHVYSGLGLPIPTPTPVVVTPVDEWFLHGINEPMGFCSEWLRVGGHSREF